MAKLEVFVSHLTIESKFADLVKSCLTRDFIGLVNFFVSSDATSIPVGSQWFDEILAAINRADLQFVICSSESVRRPWINYEAGGARVRNVQVVPLCHSGMTPEQLPVPLSMAEGVLLTDSESLKRLYVRVAGLLESDVPDVNFDQYSRDFRALESEYEKQRAAESAAIQTVGEERIVENPRVLCVSSRQYLEMGFENQLQMVLEAFPQNLRHDRVFTSRDLRQELMNGRCDIVHIAGYVCPRSGSLYFSPVELPSGAPRDGEPDLVRAEALAMLLKDAQTKLVVIASGDSLALATTLLGVTNVIAPRDIVSAQAMASWVQTFYEALRKKPLAVACELASTMSRAPMKLLGRQEVPPDLQFMSAQ
jgi:TIR domain